MKKNLMLIVIALLFCVNQTKSMEFFQYELVKTLTSYTPAVIGAMFALRHFLNAQKECLNSIIVYQRINNPGARIYVGRGYPNSEYYNIRDTKRFQGFIIFLCGGVGSLLLNNYLG